MEVIYPVGRVYKLVSTNGLAYIGSSRNTLNQRLAGHKCDYIRFLKKLRRYLTSFDLYKDDSTVSIELIEEINNVSKTGLHARERYHIETNICVNKFIPTRTDAEYRKDTKLHRKEYAKAYSQSDDYKLIRAEWMERNKELYKTTRQKYYESRITCSICQSEMRKHSKSQHEKTAKHRLNLSLLETTTASPS